MGANVCVSHRFYDKNGRGDKKYLRISYRPKVMINGALVGSEVLSDCWLYIKPEGIEQSLHNERMSKHIEEEVSKKKYDFNKSTPLHKGDSSTMVEAMDYVLEKSENARHTKLSKITVYRIIVSYLKDRGLLNHTIGYLFGEDNGSYLMDIVSYIDGLGASDNSKTTYKRNLRSILLDMYRHSLLGTDISGRVRAKTYKAKVKEPMTVAEMDGLRATDCSIPIVKSMAMFSYYTGLRISDMLKLKYNNLSWEHKDMSSEKCYLKFEIQKTRSSYHARLDSRAVDIIKSLGTYRDKSINDDRLLFGCNSFRGPMREALGAWTRASGIKRPITMHHFRHTFARHLYDKGLDIYKLSKLLGHSNVNTTSNLC